MVKSFHANNFSMNPEDEYSEVVIFDDTGRTEDGSTQNEDQSSAIWDGSAFSKEFHSLYAKGILDVAKPLNELVHNQDVLLESMQQENERYADISSRVSIEDMFSKIVQYQTKLVNIKKDMVALHEKVIKLKKRAFHVKQIQEKQHLPEEK